MNRFQMHRIWETVRIIFEQILYYLSLDVNYKDTTVLDALFTCLLRFSTKLVKDSGRNVMFIFLHSSSILH